jgi:thiol-disulfide isomerase/thioredoxin
LKGKPHFCSVFKAGIAFIFLVCAVVYSAGQEPSVPVKAPLFTAVTAYGDTLSLANQRGNIVLLDFWTSWNQPSRKHNLTTVKIYEKYRAVSLRKKKKFVVIQVSLDTREDLWRAVLIKDNLYWKTHICDLKGWNSPFVSLYDLKRIPTNFLIDTAGNVVGKDLWENRLDSALGVWMK